jgi:uncharacterized membrane protein YbhN (UPF0104 family)
MLIRKFGKYYTLLVATSLFFGSAWYLAEHFHWREALRYLLYTDFVKFISTIWIVQFAYICVRTWRWKIVVGHANRELKFWDLYWITAIVVSLSNFTPGQIGEALKIELLKRRGLLGRLPGLGGFAVERILDVIVIAIMGIIGLIFGSGLAERYPGLEIGAIFLFVFGLAALYFLLHFDRGGRVSYWLSKMRAGSGTPDTWVMMGLMTLLSWCLIGIGWQISLYSVGIYLSLPEILWLISLVTLGTLLSFIPGGFGVAEVMIVKALIIMGVTPIAAQAGALILRIYGFTILLFGCAHLLLWFLYRVKSKFNRQD